MAFAASQATSSQQTFGARLRAAAIGALFALVLLVPKILHLRRNPRTWFLFRLALGLVGAAIVVLPLGLSTSWFASIVGLAMFLTAVLLPPAKRDACVDEKTRELGALVVVNGGEYQPGNALPAPVRLFVGPERIWALDSRLQPLLVIPVAEVTSACAEESYGRDWFLCIRWSDRAAEFSYRGIFAEHLARVAETTLRGVIHSPLPVLPRSRAARA
jgi:hypothetical protein